MTRRLPAWLPRSMASRLSVILISGLLLAQGLTFGLLAYERYQSATMVMLNTLEHEVGTSVAILDRLPTNERVAWLPRLARDNYHFLLGPGEPGAPLASERSREVTQRITNEVGAAYAVKAQTVSMKPERYQVHLTLSDGAPLTLEVNPHPPAMASWLPFVFMVQMVVLLVCAWLAVRFVTRPLAQLAGAAEAMSPTADTRHLPEDGPTEVAQAAVAFNAMQDRIAVYLKERLHILASISHDLQTPITRMRLRAESLDAGPESDRLLADLAEMEHLVREGVAYARSAHGGDEAPVKMDPAAFIESLVFDYQDMGQPVSLAEMAHGAAMVRPRALRRVLTNVIDNAIKYGGSAEVASCRGADGALSITVSDSGPGIPESELENVTQPFHRLEGSRNRDTGGAGLGLAIAVQLMRSIGGDLRLANREGGGLIVRLSLP